jgi:D-glycero-alpha-D-manno-heptose-7-phosphate kinase
LKDEIMDELNSRLLLCYVGGSHFSGSIHKRQEESFAGGEEDYVRKVGVNKRIATDFKDSLLTGKLTNLGPLLHESWQVKKEWIEDVSNPRIDTLYDAGLRNGANGGKLLGAGGAGYLLFSYSPTKRNALVRALESEGGEILDFNFEFKGAHTWTVKQ